MKQLKENSLYDVVALGELLIDFTNNGISEQGNIMFEANPGGAPCNVLSMLNNLGHKTAFIGKVGDDMFGKLLRDAVTSVGIDDTYLFDTNIANTTLAFVKTFEDGDRDFSFYRNPGADTMLTIDDVMKATPVINDCKIFHFGSLSLTNNVSRDATYKAVEVAREAGAVISFDPNLREPLWPTLDDAKEQISWGLKFADVVKISDNEITWFTGISDFHEAAIKLKEMYPNIELLLVSLGKDGSFSYDGRNFVDEPAFLLPNTIETTGAGDTFGASILHQLLESGMREYKPQELSNILRFANSAAAIVTTRKGALKVMPTIDEINELNALR